MVQVPSKTCQTSVEACKWTTIWFRWVEQEIEVKHLHFRTDFRHYWSIPKPEEQNKRKDKESQNKRMKTCNTSYMTTQKMSVKEINHGKKK